MRIRKNAKISPLCFCSEVSAAAVVGGTTTTTTATTQVKQQVCQLNQSPWDLIPLTLPDSCWNYQAAEGDDSSGVTAANGSLGDSTGAPWSVASLKMSMEEGPAIISSSRSQDMMNVDDDEGGNVGDGFESRGRGGGVPYRARARGASPWLAYKGGFASYDTNHHLTSSYEHHSSPISESEMEAKAEPEAEAVQVLRRPSRGRPKKPPSAAASANPHEFYYYSGFGPLWGKRRGSGTREIGISNNASAATTEAILVQEEEEEEEVDFNNNDYVNEEEDDDDNGDDGITTGRKRIRKPVKARSLKSLM